MRSLVAIALCLWTNEANALHIEARNGQPARGTMTFTGTVQSSMSVAYEEYHLGDGITRYEMTASRVHDEPFSWARSFYVLGHPEEVAVLVEREPDIAAPDALVLMDTPSGLEMLAKAVNPLSQATQ